MKNMKKLASLLLALVMVFSLATTAFAKTVGEAADGKGSITVNNAVNGETYYLVKLFDANVTGTAGGSIYYTTTNVDADGNMAIPEGLEDYFEVKNVDANGKTIAPPYIVATAAAKDANGELTGDAVTAITNWAKGQTDTATEGVADASGLVFQGLDYGYYVVLSTFGKDATGGDGTYGAAISVTSTNPNGVLNEKNAEVPVATKEVDDKDINIGDTVEYTATFDTVNMLEGKVVTDYIIYDTLPVFLSDVEVTSIKVGDKEITTDTDNDGKKDQQFSDVTYGKDADGNAIKYENAIKIEWADYDDATDNWVSKYTNGTQIVVTYTATVNDNIAIGGNETNEDTADGNVNTVTLQPYTGEPDNNNPNPYKDHFDDKNEIYTYAAALRKVDGDYNPLAGATFSVTGLVATGDNGLYVVSSYDPDGKDDAGNDIVATVMKTDDDGYLVIEGLNSDAELVVTEVEAPAGYNKLTETITVEPIITTAVVESSTTTVYYDAEGNVVGSDSNYASSHTVVNTLDAVKSNANNYQVVNQAGTELPSTGGMGTTLFYVFGSILVIGAAVLLVTKKRMGEAQ